MSMFTQISKSFKTDLCSTLSRERIASALSIGIYFYITVQHSSAYTVVGATSYMYA